MKSGIGIVKAVERSHKPFLWKAVPTIKKGGPSGGGGGSDKVIMIGTRGPSSTAARKGAEAGLTVGKPVAGGVQPKPRRYGTRQQAQMAAKPKFRPRGSGGPK